jgi:hypothetical protein
MKLYDSIRQLHTIITCLTETGTPVPKYKPQNVTSNENKKSTIYVEKIMLQSEENTWERTYIL